ncbi:MAG: hypothetical protein RL266_882, partial [Bacteroidota bacterium]
SFESYGTDRDFTQNEETPAAGGLGPEDIDFIPAGESPTGFPLLLVSNEVSGSISVYSVSGLPTADPLVITEIMYNPPESDTDSLEFVEIYNLSQDEIDLSGYFFRQGFDFVFPQGATVAGNGFVIVAVDDTIFQDWYGMTAYEWEVGDATSNSGEDLVLAAPSGAVADSVDYDDVSPWPSEADGGGYSIVRCDPFADGNDGNNWSAASVSAGFSVQTVPATEIFADPGSSNCFTVDIKEEIITTIVNLYPNPNGGTFQVEVAEFEGDATLGVYNTTGQLLKSEKLTNSGVVTFVEQLSAGVYLLKCETADQVSVQRFVVK